MPDYAVELRGTRRLIGIVWMKHGNIRSVIPMDLRMSIEQNCAENGMPITHDPPMTENVTGAAAGAEAAEVVQKHSASPFGVITGIVSPVSFPAVDVVAPPID